ncbi:MAG: putative phosphohistidine phosphatase [Betaproteobacteria bacterium]|nr:putative phosphohistidine phosphatase [Betaproteobacteria bacterium]
MHLILWRHAEAEEGKNDMKRPLTKRGLKQASLAAAWLHANLPKGARILVSPAVRAQQTAQALTLDFETVPGLAPDQSVADLLAAVDWPQGGGADGKASGAILVVGHQPTLGQSVALLLSGSEAEWSIKKSAIWWLTARTREDEARTALRAVWSPEFAM